MKDKIKNIAEKLEHQIRMHATLKGNDIIFLYIFVIIIWSDYLILHLVLQSPQTAFRAGIWHKPFR